MILGSSPLGILWRPAFAVSSKSNFLFSCTNSCGVPLTALLHYIFNHLVKESLVVYKFRKGWKGGSPTPNCLFFWPNLSGSLSISASPCTPVSQRFLVGKKQTQVLTASSFFSYPSGRERWMRKIHKIYLFCARWDLTASTQHSEGNAVAEQV